MTPRNHDVLRAACVFKNQRIGFLQLAVSAPVRSGRSGSGLARRHAWTRKRPNCRIPLHTAPSHSASCWFICVER